ncbi:MAG TPA: ATP-dependent helicase [Solirubrobacteraceae bacterium]|nr:ATP-dependent helicase [Solirubrobacteraceae bacterium]
MRERVRRHAGPSIATGKYSRAVSPSLAWAASLDREALAAARYEVVEFGALRREVIARAGSSRVRRTSIENPAQDWLDRVGHSPRLAVLGVSLCNLDDLAALHGYVLEPALRAGAVLAIESDQRLTRLSPERFIDPDFAYPYTLERAIDAATRLYRGSPAPYPAQSPDLVKVHFAADREQLRAINAHDGIVQVIAPAGSGKTAVLIERVGELLRRGVPADRILCTTFNRDARLELEQRLRAAGVPSVVARTFHSTGWWLMREEGLARRNGVREASFNQWRRLCALALRETGRWLDPADARAAIGTAKLGLLATPHEFAEQAHRYPEGETVAYLYELYERQLADDQVHDFDDLVLGAVRALRADAELRRRWQSRFGQVLVDEYQDVEPAQELLVRILAAPQDGFFCVGDEDQTLYGWRRASVRRILDLDLAYPGLERIALAHNYRCPPDVVEASRRLIEHNDIRFPKEIRSSSAPVGAPGVRLCMHETQPDGADEIAALLAGHTRGEIVVLARTTNLLRTVALGCSVLGVKIAAPEQVFESAGARGALEAYVRLCSDPANAEDGDVARVCRAPGRGLPLDAEQQVAASLRAGRSFTESFATVAAGARQRARLDEAGVILDALARITDAGRFVRYLRGPGGLDDHFGEHERAFGGTERIEVEVLEQASREASGKAVAEYAALLQSRRDALAAIRDDEHGIELTTIHRAKGCQWPEVHVFGCDEGQLPHARSLEVGPQERAAGEGIEAERRLAYVAFTRAQRGLALHWTTGATSRFLTEAGLVAPVTVEPPPPPPPPPPPRSGKRRRGRGRRGDGPAAQVVAEAERVGLGHALRTAPSRDAALAGAADVIEARLVGPKTASARMSVLDLLAAVEHLDERTADALLQSAGIDNGHRRITRLHARARTRLVRALRDLAAPPRDV